jgi:hypothetical protein
MTHVRPPTVTARQVALAAGAIGLVGCALGAWLDRVAFFEAWLVTWLFLLGIALAGMAQVMIHELTGGAWGRVLRAPLEAVTLTLPLLALLALPLAWGLPDLFAWARPDEVAKSASMQAQAWYLAPTPFVIRNAVLLVLWSMLGVAMVRRANAPAGAAAARHIAVPGLLVYLLTVTIAAFDWVAALVPGWSSSALGVRLGTAQFLASLAFAVVFVVVRDRRDATVLPARDCQDFGNLLLTYAMMWAYIAFTQYLIVWSEDLPRETLWFWPRATTSWRWLVIVVVALEFALPVAAMLFRRVKRDPVALAAVCALVLVGQWLDTLWLIAPSLRPRGFEVRLLDGAALLGLGGMWLYAVLRIAARLPVPRISTQRVAAHG